MTEIFLDGIALRQYGLTDVTLGISTTRAGGQALVSGVAASGAAADA